MKKKNKIINICISAFLLFSVFVNTNTSKFMVSAEENTIEFVVKEDAFVRNGSRANNKYNYEDITAAHGKEYEGKGYKVLNTRYSGNDEIISVMKFDLPTKEEIETNNLDTFILELDIFKNLNYTVANQGYVFHYTTDTSWDETTITWNTKPSSISRDNTNEIFTFYIDQGDEYEFKDDAEKHLKRDISSTIIDLVNSGESELTIFITAKYSANTGLMIHSKESQAENKKAKIVASSEGIDLDSLKSLVEKVSDISIDNYTKDSYKEVKENLILANELINENSKDLVQIQKYYHLLQSAFESLEIKHVNVYEDMEKRIYNDGSEDAMPYRLYVPENYDSTKEYPVIVFLHGAGERGNNNESQLKNAIQPLFNTQDGAKEAIIIAPQCPTGKRWVETDWTKGVYNSDEISEVQLKSVMNILGDIQSEYHTDNDRIYAFGLSMGGFGTWDLITRHSDVFAAAIAICGSGDENKANILKDIPIWTFHGTKDNVVPYSGTETMYNAIIEAGGEKIKFTTYTDADHIIWNQAASENGLIDWLFSQKLSDRLVDKTNLQVLVDDIEKLDEIEYTPNSWETLMNQLKAANDVLKDSNVSQDDVNEALIMLQSVIDKLDNRSNTSELKMLIDVVTALHEIDYTPNSWTVLNKSLANAKEVVVDKNASQVAVNAAKADLQSANDLLVKRANIKDLVNLVNDISKKVESDYTPASWATFEEALKAAQTIVNDANTTQKQVEDALTTLKNANDSLVLQNVDKVKLDNLVNELSSLIESEYTKESWNQLQSELDKARELLKKEDLTQEEVDDSIRLLQEAHKQLVRKKANIIVDSTKTPNKNESSNATINDIGTKTGDTTNLSILIGMVIVSLGYLSYRLKRINSR